LLARELLAFGAQSAKERSTGVAFTGTLRTAYRACLESRLANRVFLELGRFEVADAEGFYRAVRGIDWPAHFAPGATLACDFSGRHPLITHTHFGALKLKDAIVDSIREGTGSRPDVALERPSVRVHAHANGTVITVSLDLSGESLHRRGYRGAAGEAPLKENVAAGMLMRSGWGEMAASGAQFLDPMCGSGTLVIEAALIAADIAPGLARDYYGFLGWRGHDAQVWGEVLEEAKGRARAAAGSAQPPLIIRGQDRDGAMIRIARGNAERAGVGGVAEFEVRVLADAAPAVAARAGVPAVAARADGSARGVHGASASVAPDDVAGDAPQAESRPGAPARKSVYGATWVASDDDAGEAPQGESRPGAPARESVYGATWVASDDDAGDASQEVGSHADAPARKTVYGATWVAADAGGDASAVEAYEDAGDAPAVQAHADTPARGVYGASMPSADGGGDALPAESESASHSDASAPRAAAHAAGLLCVNPPYGVRMEDRDGALAVHRELGKVLRERFQGWIAGVLIGSPELGMELGIRAFRTHTLWNGALECRLLRLKIDSDSEREPGRFSKPDATLRESPGARMFGNRLGKNLKRLQTWASRSDVSCYRVYDADMPEYAFAIDIYRTLEPDLTWLYVQEYAAPAEIELEAVRRRRNEALSVLPEVTGVPQERIHVRTRRRNKRGEQYRKVDEQANFHFVMEGGLRFRVNFDDYLDTGLFLDHRMTRARLRDAASGKRFLNLFAYTGTATVYAAAGGAVSTTTVDMSRTYLDWAQRNLSINGMTSRQHALVQADCREWLQESVAHTARYDLIFLDPPTFSNSKRMEGVLDIERDHGSLVHACAKLLAPGGLLVFSTNAQRFKLDDALAAPYDIRDISAATLPRDFERNPRIHRCFEIRVK
jgi:23S rRNA G2445 N2-methylase RlmL/23S rRNA G2069 N7-methylase RlmK/C1962 C5-methylase RlmI